MKKILSVKTNFVNYTIMFLAIKHNGYQFLQMLNELVCNTIKPVVQAAMKAYLLALNTSNIEMMMMLMMKSMKKVLSNNNED